MKKELFSKVTVKAGEELTSDMRLTYYLLTDSPEREFGDIDVYGVEIKKEMLSGEVRDGIERKSVGELFFRKRDAEEFLNLISRNRVTPIELKYIIRDYVCQQIDRKVVNNVQ